MTLRHVDTTPITQDTTMVNFLFPPDSWQARLWNPRECAIVNLKGGGFGILDHSIQTLVAEGNTATACQQFINDHR